MGRPKTSYPDLLPGMTARRSGQSLCYYFASGPKKIPLGRDKEAAVQKATRLSQIFREVGMPDLQEARLGDLAFRSQEEIAAKAIPMKRQSGVYFLLTKGRIVYVGQSMDVWQRIQQHRAQGRRFDSFAWSPCPLHELNALEAYCIRKYNPEQNTVGLEPSRTKRLQAIE